LAVHLNPLIEPSFGTTTARPPEIPTDKRFFVRYQTDPAIDM